MNKPVRIMPCLDMQGGRVVKGVQFVDIKDAGDPVACCQAYIGQGADEIAMLDISATVENRPTLLSVVKAVSAVASVPFTVGGGIRDVASAAAVLEAAREGGLLIGKGGGHDTSVLRIAPPLSLTIPEAEEGAEILAGALRAAG